MEKLAIFQKNKKKEKEMPTDLRKFQTSAVTMLFLSAVGEKHPNSVLIDN